MTSTTVVLSDLFQRSQARLDGSIKSRVLDFIVKLQHDPGSPGLRLKTPQGVDDKRIKVGRVNDDYRAVVIELPDSGGYVLAAVRSHDDAYEYAASLRYGVNEVTGAYEVADQAATWRALDAADAEPVTDQSPGPVLAGIKASTLTTFGVPQDIADRLVAISDENAFFTAADTLPRAQSDAVLDLLSGRSPDDVWAELVQLEPETKIDTNDIDTALQRPLSRLSFVSSENQEEFQAALKGDMEAWRVWLHPVQRRLVEHRGWNGPYRVTGGAGTGKTVAAIHRARHLAKRVRAQIEEGTLPSGSKVLVTTFTKNLAVTIQAQLVKLAGSAVLDHVEVTNIDQLARQIWQYNNATQRRYRFVGDDDRYLNEIWAAVASDTDFDIGFLANEWRSVVLAHGIRSREAYLKVSRAGRGRRLSRPQRAKVWSVFEKFQQQLSAESVMTFMQVADQAADMTSAVYAHGIVDEAQDLHPAHWRLLRAVVQSGIDDLFIVGDAHQRIYSRPIVLSHYGIETRGRSRRLTVNYRTSRQILRWCLAVAQGTQVDDLEGEGETLAGARSEFDGPEPQTIGYPDIGAENSGIIENLKHWYGAAANGENPLSWRDIGLVSRTNGILDDVQQALEDAQIPTVRITGQTDEAATGDAVRLMTMHRAKGLEYRAMILARLSADVVPPSWLIEHQYDEDAFLAAERNLVYVAGSRARERLLITYSSQPSMLLPENNLG